MGTRAARRTGIAVILAVLVGCAPAVDGPVERQRATDRADADRTGAQLATLPGALSASVTIHRPARDPLGVSPPSPASAAALIVVDNRADRIEVTTAATALLRAAAPEVATPTVVTVVGAHRPELARVGPFTVAAASKGTLKAALALALGVIAVLAGWIALRERQRRAT
ncbi:MAG: hypothetical protein SFX73_22125 [Kofleriaceae bacterium]|nr:hypothetical protein [Kofleriaceae bacterium]